MRSNRLLEKLGFRFDRGHVVGRGDREDPAQTPRRLEARAWASTAEADSKAKLRSTSGNESLFKEDVIMGRRIPAGTGMEFYRKIKIPGR